MASIHNVSNFLKLSGLSSFVASSYTTQCRESNKMDDFIIEFGENEQQRLAKTMRPKKITLAEDETFHPQTCLVSIEPVSNYIIAEKYSENRKGETWTKLIQESIEGLPVEVIQITSDGGTGLLSHALNDFTELGQRWAHQIARLEEKKDSADNEDQRADESMETNAEL